MQRLMIMFLTVAIACQALFAQRTNISPYRYNHDAYGERFDGSEYKQWTKH
jgi:hypothetical protein